MANTRLGLVNWITSAGAVLKNGTGGGAPALNEQAPYTMSKLLTWDRYLYWKSATMASPTAYDVDIDLGASRAVDLLAINGYKTASGVGIAVDFYYQTGAYNAAGTWTYLATLAAGIRDVGVQITPVTARSMRMRVIPNSGSTVCRVGNFFAGQLVDLGGRHSPGGLYAPVRNRIELGTPGGVTFLSDTGDPGADLTLPWESASDAQRATLLALHDLTGSFIMLDGDGACFEVYVVNGRIGAERQFIGRSDMSVELRRLP